MTKEEMRKEAAERMHMLGLLDEKEQSVIRDFEEEHKVYVSRPTNLGVMVGEIGRASCRERV